MRRTVAQVVAPYVVLAWLVPATGWPTTAAQQSFRTSLTATVSHLPAVGADAGAGSDAGARSDAGAVLTGTADALRCRQVTLHWIPLPGARRYTVYVSVTGDKPWRALAKRNACGASRASGPTSVVDVEPTTGGATVVRRLYYKVAAFDRAGAGARLLATTTAVPVELP